MKWKVFGVAMLLGACNLSDPETGPIANNGNNQNNENNVNNTNNANNAECDPACVNGACNVDVCECDTGYAGSACDACAAEFQDNDSDGVCEPSCVSADCGFGTCSDTTGQIVCDCDDGYTGDGCDTCDAGYQDNNGDGTCEVDCATAALDCMPHGTCNDDDGTATCVCPLGTEGDGTTCDIDVPDTFEGWTAYGDASVGPNVATFPQSSLCDTTSGVSGSYMLADENIIGAAKGTIEYTNAEDCPDGFCSPGFSPPSIRLNGGQFDYLGRGNFQVGPATQDFCLGQAYFGDVAMDLVPTNIIGSCSGNQYSGLGTITDVEFERVDPASYECPMPGFAINGNFEGPANGDPVPGWIAAGSSGVVEIVNENNNNLLHLRVDQACRSVSARSKINIPASDEALAMKFQIRSSGAPYLYALFGDTRFAIPNRANAGEAEICIPAHAHGTVEEIEFGTRNAFGSCQTTATREMYLDDIRIEPSDDCEVADGVVNGTFDEGTEGWANNLSVVNGEPSSITYSSIGNENIVTLSSANECSSPSISQPIYVPSDGSLNAVQINYRLENTSKAQASVGLTGRHGSAGVQGDLPATGANNGTDTSCIPKEAWGYPTSLRIALGVRGGGGCANPQPVPLVIADVKLLNDANCN